MKTRWISAFVLLILGMGVVAYASASSPYQLQYGIQIWVEGDLSAAGISYNRESALVIKNLRNIENVTPGVNQKSTDKEVMSINIYNHAKGIVSGDRGYDVIPFNEQSVKNQAREFNGNPDYVWNAIQSNSKAIFKIYDEVLGYSEWVNVAVVRDLSGGGGSPIVPLNNHSKQEWGYYNSGQLDKFDFSKPINRSTHKITNWPKIREFKLNTGNEISEASSFVFDLSTYGVYDKQFNATFFINNDPTGVKVPVTPITSEYEMRFNGQIKVTDIPGFLDKIRANESANNSIKLVLEDGYGRTAEEKIKVSYKDLGKIYVIGEIFADPERKQFDGDDVPVKVTVRGTVVGLEESEISHWVITAKKEQDSFDRREILSGSHTTRENTFNFIIPKSVMKDVDEYIQNWVGQATVFDNNGRAYTHDPVVTETIVYKVADPDPPGVCPPDIKPASAKIYEPRGLNFDEKPKIRFEVTSYSRLDLENYRIEIRDDKGKLVHRIMNEGGTINIPVQRVDRFTRNGVNWDMYELDLPNDLEKGVNYSISVRVKEADGLPAWCSKTSEKRDFILATRPIADFEFPEEIYVGDDIPLTNTSTHPDDLPMTAEWEIKNPLGNIDSTGNEWDHEILDSIKGIYEGTLTVTDSLGAKDTVEKQIPVLDPRPIANLVITGTPKENRKLTFDATGSTAPERFPIIEEKTRITITPITPGISSDVIKPSYVITGQLKVDGLIKQEGLYKVELYVENERGSDTTERAILIQPDLKPYVNYSFEEGSVIFRDPEDSLLATVILNNESYSPDQDILAQRIWRITYNSNNDKNPDGSPKFTNNTPLIIKESDLENGPKTYTHEGFTYIAEIIDGQLHIKVSEIGYYLINLEVIEEFGQPTIDAFVTPEDRRRDNTFSNPIESRVLKVDNLPPTVNWIRN